MYVRLFMFVLCCVGNCLLIRWSGVHRSPTRCVCVCVCVLLCLCHLETSKEAAQKRPDLGCSATEKNFNVRRPFITNGFPVVWGGKLDYGLQMIMLYTESVLDSVHHSAS